MFRHIGICAVALVGATVISASSAGALTVQECSAKYKAAQTAGTLKGMKWNDFRKSECGPTATAAPAAAPATTAPPAAPAKPVASPKPAPAAATNAVFPTAIAPKYSTKSAGKGRMHTCLDQYNANKTNNANGGLNWIQKGGGYYSECNKRLSQQ